MRHEWQRQPKEPARAFEAFVFYRDLPADERSLNAAYQRRFLRSGSTRAPGQWAEWSSKYRWVERAAAYDAHLDDEQRKVREHRLRKLAERRIDFELANQERLERRVARIETLLDKADVAPITDVTQEKADEKGVNVRTKVKGLNLSGYARLARQSDDAARQAILGVRPADAGVVRKTGDQPVEGKGEFVWVKPKADSDEAPPSSDAK